MKYLIVLLLIAGCAAPGRVVTGEPVAPPSGHVMECLRRPNVPECSK